MKIRALIICVTLLLTLPVAAAAGLARAGACGGCHDKNFNAWLSSAHARSISSDGFRSALSQYLLEEDSDDGRFCFKCHAPVILISGDWFEATKALLKGKTSGEGVTCIVCHGMESVKDGRAVYDLGNLSGYHRVKNLRSIDRASLCTTCHSYYKPISPDAVPAKGLINGLASGFRRLVGAKTVKKSDHMFPEVVVAATENESCPGMEGD